MKRVLSGVFAAVLTVAAATAAFSQSKPPLKLGGILDMSGLYADITGAGSEMAAKMAVEDFGGEVLGRKVEIVTADHLNKADLAANIARDMFDNQHVEMLFDVAASATALAAGEIAKARNRVVIFNGPGSIRLSNEACGPYTVHYVFDTFAQANVTGGATVKQGLDTWFFLTADYAFGQDLEKDTTNIVQKSGGKGRRHDGRRRRHQGHEANPDQRHVHQERADPRGRPHGARHVPVRGQEAVRIQGTLGRLQAARDRARQRGVPAAGSLALSAGAEVTAERPSFRGAH